MKKHFFLILILGIFSACGGGSSNPGPGEPPIDTSNPGTADEAVAKGLGAFKARDLSGARDAFCKELPDEPQDSRLAFGCFWARWMLLPTSTEAASLLAVFDEEALLPEVHYYGGDGIFTRIAEVDRAQGQIFPQFNYGDFDLPFRSFDPAMTVQSILFRRAVQNGASAGQIQALLDALTPELEILSDLGEVFLAADSFAFTLPKELFNLSQDLPVTPNDAALFVSGVEGVLFLEHVLAGYDFGVELPKVSRETYIDDKALLEDLNGSGATYDGITFDEVAFLTLRDSGRILAAKPRFLKACELAKRGLEKLEAGEASAWFGPARGETSYVEAISLLGDLLASVEGPREIQAFTAHPLTLNMGRFFSDPPDAAAMPAAAGDPFVLEDGNVQPVESYFRDLFSGVAEF